MQVEKLETIGKKPVEVTKSKDILVKKEKLSAEVSLSLMI